jgi:hypothetical protein
MPEDGYCPTWKMAWSGGGEKGDQTAIFFFMGGGEFDASAN